jgi:hypothetical protein
LWEAVQVWSLKKQKTHKNKGLGLIWDAPGLCLWQISAFRGLVKNQYF